MADLTIRRGGNIAPQNDPFQMVRESMRRMQDLFRDPLYEIDPIGLLESGRMLAFSPNFEVRETKDGLVFHADVPGVKENDIDLTIVGNRLRINGKRDVQQESRGDTWYAAERAYGSFSRTFVLPDGCDTNNIDATLQDGVLTIRLAKRQEAQPRRILLGGQKPAIEGQYSQEQYSQGPFHQSAAQPEPQNVGLGVGQNVPAQGAQAKGSGYGGMYGSTPEAGRSEFGAAAGGFEHAEQAGGVGRGGDVEASKRRVSDEPEEG